ncbi:MAG: c-type cytochrome [Pseudomonadales bacterium]|nr:cytochrome c [Pseudomonadales bacterium]NIX07473.1 c-type cytochrome [Pseudomonadales bacterium]
MSRTRRALVVGYLCLGIVAPEVAADTTLRGNALAEAKGCVACHGRDGVAIAPIYPNLAGQWKRYLREQLHAYRSGKRQNSLMSGFAAGLSDDEIRRLADHYGSK